MSRGIDNLRAALAKYQAGLRVIDDASAMALLGDDAQDMVRAGVIQHMEMVYELSWKAIQRWVQANLSEQELEGSYSRKDLFRVAGRVGLVADPVRWFAFMEARNSTSHVYNREVADEVLRHAHALAVETGALLARLSAMEVEPDA